MTNQGVSMKFLIMTVVTAFSFGAFAQQDLNTMKSQATQNIDKKMSSLQTAKNCVSNAQSMEKFKACKYDMHEEMKMQKQEMMDQKKTQKGSGY
jgi:hypothetical protein